jgi:hypothetical protein
MIWNNKFNQFKKILFFLLFLCIGVSLYYQVKFEKYISNQKKAYNILQNRERISFIPAVFYYMKSRNDRDRCLNRLSQDLIYEESNISTRRIIMGYDEYIIACFYNKNEKLNYINSIPIIKNRYVIGIFTSIVYGKMNNYYYENMKPRDMILNINTNNFSN